MLSKLFKSCWHFFSQPLNGVGTCSRCSCAGYEDAGDGNSYCRCGHSYSDHW